MSKSKTGGLTGNGEWGSKALKEEDRLRGRNNRARMETIAEQVRELTTSGKEIECPYCEGTGVAQMDFLDGETVNLVECGFCVNGIHVIGT